MPIVRNLALAAAVLIAVAALALAWRRRQRRAWREAARNLGLAHRARGLFAVGVVEGPRGRVTVRVEADLGLMDFGRHDRTLCRLVAERIPTSLRMLRVTGARSLELPGVTLPAEVRDHALALARTPSVRDAVTVELRGGELVVETTGVAARAVVEIVEAGCAFLQALADADLAAPVPGPTPESLTPGTRYRVVRAFRTAEAALARGDVLRFEERIYNREDGSWLYRFSRAGGGDVWLVEADPAAIETLRELAAHLAPAEPA